MTKNFINWETYGFFTEVLWPRKIYTVFYVWIWVKGEKLFFLRRYHSLQRTNLNHFVTGSFPIENISYLQFYVVAGLKVQKMLNKLKFIVQLGLLYTFNSSLLCRSYFKNVARIIYLLNRFRRPNTVRNRNKSGNILNSTICIDRR